MNDDTVLTVNIIECSKSFLNEIICSEGDFYDDLIGVIRSFLVIYEDDLVFFDLGSTVDKETFFSAIFIYNFIFIGSDGGGTSPERQEKILREVYPKQYGTEGFLVDVPLYHHLGYHVSSCPFHTIM